MMFAARTGHLSTMQPRCDKASGLSWTLIVGLGLALALPATAQDLTIAASDSMETVPESAASDDGKMIPESKPQTEIAPPDDCQPEIEAPWHWASECPQLFGDEDTHSANLKWRHRVIKNIDEGEYSIDILHSAAWQEPTRTLIPSLTLFKTERAPNCPAIATVQVDAVELGVNCKDGLYALRVGDGIGETGRVVAILDDILLTELRGQLAYFTVSPTQRPNWRLTWRSPWRVSMPSSSGARGGHSKSKARAKTPRRATKKSPRRRKKK